MPLVFSRYIHSKRWSAILVITLRRAALGVSRSNFFKSMRLYKSWIMLISILDFHSQAAKWFYMAHQIAQLPINLSSKIIDLCLYMFMAYSMCVPQNYLLLSLCESSISFLSVCHHEGLLPDPAWECKSIHFLVPLLNFPEAMTLMTW